MSHYQLAVNTSQGCAQIILLKNKQLVGERLWSKAKSHSEVVTDHFTELLEECNVSISQIDRIYCVEGPGSFTGIRVGVNFCKALAFSLSCPIVAINTLDLLALNCDKTDSKLLVCIDAQKNSLFASQYEFQNGFWKTIRSNFVLKILSLKEEINASTYVCGNGISAYSEFIEEKTLAQLIRQESWETADLKKYFRPHCFSFLEKKLQWSQFQPKYLKASAAEEKLNPI